MLPVFFRESGQAVHHGENPLVLFVHLLYAHAEELQPVETEPGLEDLHTPFESLQQPPLNDENIREDGARYE